MSAKRPEKPTKPDAFLHLLGAGRVHLHLDGRHPAVDVPQAFKKTINLVLDYGYNLPTPISDLEVLEGGIRATLSFARTPHRTFVPWEAVYAVINDDNRGIVWEEDVPEELAKLQAAHPRAAIPDGELREEAPRLREVGAEEEPDGEAPIGVAGWKPRIVN